MEDMNVRCRDAVLKICSKHRAIETPHDVGISPQVVRSALKRI